MLKAIIIGLFMTDVMAAQLSVSGLAGEEFTANANTVTLIAAYKTTEKSRSCTISHFPYRYRSPKKHTISSSGSLKNTSFNVCVTTDWGYNKRCKYRLDSIYIDFENIDSNGANRHSITRGFSVISEKNDTYYQAAE